MCESKELSSWRAPFFISLCQDLFSLMLHYYSINNKCNGLQFVRIYIIVFLVAGSTYHEFRFIRREKLALSATFAKSIMLSFVPLVPIGSVVGYI